MGTLSKVSIVIPIYNAEAYISQGLRSLQNQTLKDIEVIMVNDGSVDGSENICRSFAERDERFVLINQENGGSAAARKKGMLAAHGEYIGFMDADDWCEPDMFEKLYTVGHSKDVDIVFCNCYRDYPDRTVMCKKQIRDGFYDRKQIEEEILPRTLAGINSKGEPNAIRWANYIRIYKRSLIEAHSIYNDPRFRRCQDLQLTFEATLCAQSYYYLGDEYLYHNRVVEGSQSRGYTKNQWEKLRILIQRLYEDVDQFNDINLHEQMDLCAFFFAVYTCENEGRRCESVSQEIKDKNIKSVYDDPLCEQFLRTIPVEKLSKVNQMYYCGLRNKDLNAIKKANRMKSAQLRKGKVKSIILRIPGVSMLRKAIKK